MDSSCAFLPSSPKDGQSSGLHRNKLCPEPLPQTSTSATHSEHKYPAIAKITQRIHLLSRFVHIHCPFGEARALYLTCTSSLSCLSRTLLHHYRRFWWRFRANLVQVFCRISGHSGSGMVSSQRYPQNVCSLNTFFLDISTQGLLHFAKIGQGGVVKTFHIVFSQVFAHQDID
jgi:hypothetical protein